MPRVELYGAQRVAVEDLDLGPGAVVELEGEAAVDHETRVEAARANLHLSSFAPRTTLGRAGEHADAEDRFK